MSNLTPSNKPLHKSLALVLVMLFSGTALGAPLAPLVDDFSHSHNNSLDLPRQFINDTIAGGATVQSQSVTDGIIRISGDITPPRGQLGWATCVLPLDANGLPHSAEAFTGVLLTVKVTKGNLSLSVNSTEISNFDYHSAPFTVTADGQFHEVKVPFTSLKRAWSAQTSLDTSTINSLSIIAYGMQQTAFDFELDEVRFY
ncbi:CIA30 family protein [Gilvimarinus polysaccharolyticus]|uniref:CIA30 family protein n=1 Tax=Gilvimarinus polysaccharolyticus TaxID=863921 RepID=UPI00067313B2|nr:CIA30 family protein [Gilvimarinus polysaccharolyticus]